MWKVGYALAPGKRQRCRGCWGREWLVGSAAPAMTSMCMAPASSVRHMSVSLQMQFPLSSYRQLGTWRGPDACTRLIDAASVNKTPSPAALMVLEVHHRRGAGLPSELGLQTSNLKRLSWLCSELLPVSCATHQAMFNNMANTQQHCPPVAWPQQGHQATDFHTGHDGMPDFKRALKGALPDLLLDSRHSYLQALKALVRVASKPFLLHNPEWQGEGCGSGLCRLEFRS